MVCLHLHRCVWGSPGCVALPPLAPAFLHMLTVPTRCRFDVTSITQQGCTTYRPRLLYPDQIHNCALGARHLRRATTYRDVPCQPSRRTFDPSLAPIPSPTTVLFLRLFFCVFGARGPREDSVCGLRYSSVHHREVEVSRSDLRRAQGQTARTWLLRSRWLGIFGIEFPSELERLLRL